MGLIEESLHWVAAEPPSDGLRWATWSTDILSASTVFDQAYVVLKRYIYSKTNTRENTHTNTPQWYNLIWQRWAEDSRQWHATLKITENKEGLEPNMKKKAARQELCTLKRFQVILSIYWEELKGYPCYTSTVVPNTNVATYWHMAKELYDH